MILKFFSFKLINNAAFGKTMKSVRKQRFYTWHNKKEEETISCQNQVIILRIYSWIVISHKKERNADNYE